MADATDALSSEQRQRQAQHAEEEDGLRAAETRVQQVSYGWLVYVSQSAMLGMTNTVDGLRLGLLYK